MKRKLFSILMVVTMLAGLVLPLVACNSSGGTDALVIMTDALDGLFNPFYSTTAPDATIVSMTQIGMLTTGYVNEEATVAFGDDEAVAVKDMDYSYDSNTDKTTYNFVIKNGIQFSDGHPLTIEDVLFNMYVYLDPVYAGSSTMYSTDIVGLSDYRTQTQGSDDSDTDEVITEQANARANNRIRELVSLFRATGEQPSGSYEASDAEMRDAISKHNPSDGYKEAISNNPDEVTSENLLADYERTLSEFRLELGRDYESAKESFTEEPYKSTGIFDEVTSFMFAEGFVKIEYEKDPITNKPIYSKIDTSKTQYMYNKEAITTKEAAIQHVYNVKTTQGLDEILLYWGTGNTLSAEYTAQAKQVILLEKITGDQLLVPSISGIVSVGHHTEETSVTVNGNTYNIAREHNEKDGTPLNKDEYDVLRITINGVDPKAIWNFAFSVAPQHYYTAANYGDQPHSVDIKNHNYGVDYASFSFHTTVIQSQKNIRVPMGAGAYVATDANNKTNPEGNAFYRDNVVYFKRNNNFMMGQPNIEKVRYQVVSATNALNVLETGAVHFVTPQFTPNNINKINSLAEKGIESTSTDQLGYGYIGINAGKVKDINLRRAIMYAMDTSLALSYYSTGTAKNIYWPMSTVSWAYPKQGNVLDQDNGRTYASGYLGDEAAKNAIQQCMTAANVSAGDSQLKLKFTIAGSSLTDHPTYATFQKAATILNECGWNVEVVADTQALTKLSTGALAVWAAAWGTTIDPDMYQVYHKNSTATSVLAWGYNEILNQDGYDTEKDILNKLSVVIDQARSTDNRKDRSDYYKTAMGYVLDLAIELPVYQRKVLYAYNAEVIDSSSLPETINPYTSPLDKMWEIKLTDKASASSGGGNLPSGAVAGIVIGCFIALWIIAVAILFATKKVSISSIKKFLRGNTNEDLGPLVFDNNVFVNDDDEYVLLEEEIYVEEEVLVDIDEEDENN